VIKEATDRRDQHSNTYRITPKELWGRERERKKEEEEKRPPPSFLPETIATPPW
jgi:hypothetical protein